MSIGIALGTLIADRYEIVRSIGSGASGEVYAARDRRGATAKGTEVALKVLHADLVFDEDTMRRFLAEARMTAQIRSPHVTAVHECGSLESGQPFIVLELLVGSDLESMREKQGAFTVDDTICFALQCLAGLSAAHVAGFVHRDLKPANLFVVEGKPKEAALKILDFGLAKAVRDHARSLTKTHSVFGTPAYIAPEQLKSSKHVDNRADIWSLGVVLYELLTNHLPFEGTDLESYVRAVMDGPATPLERHHADLRETKLPSGLGEVILRCLEKRASDRYSTATELARALAPFAPASCRSVLEEIERIADSEARTMGVAVAAASPPSSPPAAPRAKASTPIAEGLPELGQIVAEKYRIDRVLGRGGMGMVFAATHLELGERVAIKVLLPDALRDAETTTRFLREGRTAVRIRSEHVVRVLDVGASEGIPYIVMEYLEGEDLREILTQGPLPIATAVEYVLQACKALAEVHAMRAVHRDLKPANLFRVRRADGSDCVKVLDFGISKSAVIDESVTKSFSTMGTPRYMSPEQLRSSRDVDARSDIWSLGVVLFELVAGKPPFAAATVAELGAMVLAGEAPTLASVKPDVPEGLSEAIARCLRRNPDERYPTIAELANAIAPFGGSEAYSSARSITSVLDTTPRPRTTIEPLLRANPSSSSSSSNRANEPARNKRTPLLAIGLVALFFVAVGAFVIHRLMSRPIETAAAPTTSSASSSSPVIVAEPSAIVSASPVSASATASVVASTTASSSPRLVRTPTAKPAAPSVASSAPAAPASKSTGELTHDRHN